MNTINKCKPGLRSYLHLQNGTSNNFLYSKTFETGICSGPLRYPLLCKRPQSFRNYFNSRHLQNGNPFFFMRPPSHNLKVIRSYSASQNSSSLKNTTKWIIGLVSASMAGGLTYKFFAMDNQSVSVQEDRKGEKGSKNIRKFPESSEDIPDSVPYLLIGGGTAAFSAFRSIKASDPTAKVLIISEEPYYPYMRPPLTKELIVKRNKDSSDLSFTQWNGGVRSIFYEPEEFYLPCQDLIASENGGVSVARGWKVVQLNPDQKYAVLDDGKKITYNKCLLATGSLPKNLPVLSKCDPSLQKKVTLYRTVDDFLALENLIENGNSSVAVIGGGLNGSELACSLARKGLNVTQIYKEEGNMYQILPAYLSNSLTSRIKELGVKLVRNSEVTQVNLSGNKVLLTTNSNENVEVDHVIIAAGVVPNTSLAASAGLEVDQKLGGFVVNSEMQVRNDLFAAGECASFYDSLLGRRRIEHHDHAILTGRLAGENMTGAGKPLTNQSMFWTDLAPGLGYEGIGIVNSSLPTVSVYLKNEEDHEKQSQADGKTEETNGPLELQKGVIFYLDNNRVVGMILWNLFNRVAMARQVLKNNVHIEDIKEAAKLFSIPDNSLD